jgi:uncharacterized membrane protein
VRAPFDWESLIGVRLFAWLGGAALFVAAALFLNYSIQQNLISPTMRVALGLVLGAAALVAGDWLRDKADRAGQALGGAGVATLYASLYAGRSLWHLFSSPVALGGMIFVTLTAGVVAVKRDAFMLAVLGLVGGFLTPYLVSTHEDQPLALFGYLVLLDAGVVAVAGRKRWPVLGLLGVVGSGLVFGGWGLDFLDARKAPFALFAAAALAGVFACAAPLVGRSAGAKPGVVVRVTAAVAIALPLALALIVSSSDLLPIAPPVLVAYLLVLSGGAWFAGRRAELDLLAPFAAGFGALTLALRVGPDLFPAERGLTLAMFAALPIAWFGGWLARRRAPEEKMLRVAAAVALGACAIAVSSRVRYTDVNEGLLVVAVYGWAHVALLVAMAGLGGSSRLLGVALAVAGVCTGISAFGFTHDHLNDALVITAVPMLAFWALPFLGEPFRKGALAWGVAVGALVVHFPFLYAAAKGDWSDGALGAASVACGLLALGTLVFARRRLAEPQAAIAALVGGIALLFLTAAFPILLSNEWLTVAWALEAAALAWLHLRVRHRGLVLAAGVLGGATLVRLLVNPAVLEYHPRSGTPFLNWWLYTYGVSATALLAAFRFFGRREESAKSWIRLLLAVASGVVLFVLLNIEIADYYSSGTAVTFRFSGGGFEQDMTYTLAWGVFALALFGVGMRVHSRPVRVWAIVLVCITAAKGALHDVWSLGSLYRVGAIVGLAVTLLAVSYLTQRFVLPPKAHSGAPKAVQ